MSLLLKQLDDELAEVVDEVRRSLVQIRSGSRVIGAGSIWHSKGLIVTNAHVAGVGDIKVTLPDNRTLPASLLINDSSRDLAALSVDAASLPAVSLGDSEGLEPGNLVVAIGHPLGMLSVATVGVVIGSGYDWPEMPPSKREWIAVDLPLKPGNSGGPLIDTEGHLLGINTMVMGPHFGMAVPVHVIKRFLKERVRNI